MALVAPESVTVGEAGRYWLAVQRVQFEAEGELAWRLGDGFGDAKRQLVLRLDDDRLADWLERLRRHVEQRARCAWRDAEFRREAPGVLRLRIDLDTTRVLIPGRDDLYKSVPRARVADVLVRGSRVRARCRLAYVWRRDDRTCGLTVAADRVVSLPCVWATDADIDRHLTGARPPERSAPPEGARVLANFLGWLAAQGGGPYGARFVLDRYNEWRRKTGLAPHARPASAFADELSRHPRLVARIGDLWTPI
jgi:hypothetical protein